MIPRAGAWGWGLGVAVKYARVRQVGTKIVGLLLFSLVAAGLSVAATVGAASPATAAGIRPAFEMPFPCGETWRLSTRENHPTGSGLYYALDLNKGGGADDRGMTVVASADGTLHIVSPSGVNTVYIDHGDGWRSRYLHMEGPGSDGIRPFEIYDGMSVVKGDPIGRVSNYGSKDVHLHYEQLANSPASPDVFVVQPVVFNGIPVDYAPGYDNDVGIWSYSAPGMSLPSNNCGEPPLEGYEVVVTAHPDLVHNASSPLYDPDSPDYHPDYYGTVTFRVDKVDDQAEAIDHPEAYIQYSDVGSNNWRQFTEPIDMTGTWWGSGSWRNPSKTYDYRVRFTDGVAGAYSDVFSIAVGVVPQVTLDVESASIAAGTDVVAAVAVTQPGLESPPALGGTAYIEYTQDDTNATPADDVEWSRLTDRPVEIDSTDHGTQRWAPSRGYWYRVSYGSAPEPYHSDPAYVGVNEATSVTFDLPEDWTIPKGGEVTAQVGVSAPDGTDARAQIEYWTSAGWLPLYDEPFNIDDGIGSRVKWTPSQSYDYRVCVVGDYPYASKASWKCSALDTAPNSNTDGTFTISVVAPTVTLTPSETTIPLGTSAETAVTVSPPGDGPAIIKYFHPIDGWIPMTTIPVTITDGTGNGVEWEPSRTYLYKACFGSGLLETCSSETEIEVIVPTISTTPDAEEILPGADAGVTVSFRSCGRLRRADRIQRFGWVMDSVLGDLHLRSRWRGAPHVVAPFEVLRLQSLRRGRGDANVLRSIHHRGRTGRDAGRDGDPLGRKAGVTVRVAPEGQRVCIHPVPGPGHNVRARVRGSVRGEGRSR